MSEIVERLRGFWGDVSNRDIIEAADEIERLREALEKIAALPPTGDAGEIVEKLKGHVDFEKAYLSGYEDGVEKTAAYFETPEAAERVKQRLMPLIDAVRAATIEECALVIDRDIHTYDSEMRSYAEGFAAAIRATLSPAPSKGGDDE